MLTDRQTDSTEDNTTFAARTVILQYDVSRRLATVRSDVHSRRPACGINYEFYGFSVCASRPAPPADPATRCVLAVSGRVLRRDAERSPVLPLTNQRRYIAPE